MLMILHGSLYDEIACKLELWRWWRVLIARSVVDECSHRCREQKISKCRNTSKFKSKLHAAK